jgi:hypothetical protein
MGKKTAMAHISVYIYLFVKICTIYKVSVSYVADKIKNKFW